MSEHENGTADIARTVKGTRLAQIWRNSRINSRLPPASLLNFIAGLLAGAGINLLTSVATGPTTVPTHDIVLDSVIWVAAAAFTAAAAQTAEAAERRAELEMSKDFSAQLNHEIRRQKATEVSPRFWLVLLAGLICIVVAVIWIPANTPAKQSVIRPAVHESSSLTTAGAYPDTVIGLRRPHPARTPPG